MNEPILRMRGIHRTYKTDAGPLPVLKGVDMDLYPGEIVGLIGPSGSGKSSLLHAAGLLEHPDAGAIFVDGQDCSNLNESARTKVRLSTVGFVYQFHHLLPEFSALDNVAMPQRILGVSAAEARARAADLLDQLGLAARGGHQPGQLSGGEQQRVAVARALANSPKVLLADEPTGNLDPHTSTSVFQSLFDLTRKNGVAALIATHNMELARYMDRVFTLEDGHMAVWHAPVL
jgi:lipoprotein-releasing system ATP-binding protein